VRQNFITSLEDSATLQETSERSSNIPSKLTNIRYIPWLTDEETEEYNADEYMLTSRTPC
jgi:hypothetical protein